MYYPGVFLRGLAMGAADVVPGVSGGTVALITGIYATLIRSLGAIDVEFFRLVFSLKIAAAWRHVNGNFLLALLAGIAVSLFSLAKIITYALETYPEPVYAFFIGLVLASSVLLWRDITPARASHIGWLILGAVFMWGVSELRPMNVDATPLILFGGGAIAICAMILPGISGSFLLLMMGLYPVVLAAIDALDFATLAIFATGCLVGLLSFVRVLSWLLQHYRNNLMAFLVGVLVASVKVLWPWSGGELGSGLEQGIAALAFAVGIALVGTLGYLGRHQAA